MPLKFFTGTRPLSFIYFNNINPLFSQQRQNSCIAEYFRNNKISACKQKFKLFAVPYHSPFILSAHTLSTCHAKALENKVDLIPKSMGVCSVEDRWSVSNHRVPQLLNSHKLWCHKKKDRVSCENKSGGKVKKKFV